MGLDPKLVECLKLVDAKIAKLKQIPRPPLIGDIAFDPPPSRTCGALGRSTSTAPSAAALPSPGMQPATPPHGVLDEWSLSDACGREPLFPGWRGVDVILNPHPMSPDSKNRVRHLGEELKTDKVMALSRPDKASISSNINIIIKGIHLLEKEQLVQYLSLIAQYYKMLKMMPESIACQDRADSLSFYI